MIVVRVMTIKDYDDVYELWMNTKGMGMRNLDDSRSGIAKFLERNPTTNFIASDGNKIVGVIFLKSANSNSSLLFRFSIPVCNKISSASS